MSDPIVPAIPENSVLLHVGLPKTGTTALQNAAANQRAALLEHGVRYPGDRHNHSNASFSVAGRPRGWRRGPGTAAPPSLKHWNALVSEVQAEHERRVFISHEYFAEHPAAVCRRIADDLGRDIHVVFSMRNQASILRSSWQEYLKTGVSLTYGDWLEAVLADPPVSSVTPSFHKRLARADNVLKWAEVVGTENVSIVVLDPTDRDLLTNTFESFLGLPHSLLSEVSLHGGQLNRSFSAPEAEVVRSVNEVLTQVDGMTWKDYRALHKFGGVERLLENRVPGPDEPGIVTPTWAVERMSEQARVRTEEIARTGVRVYGDLENLWTPISSVPEIPPAPAQVPTEVARELVLGTFSAGTGRGPSFGPVPAPPAPKPAPVVRPAAPVVEPCGGRRTQARAVAAATSRVAVSTVLLSVALRAARRVRRSVRPSARAR